MSSPLPPGRAAYLPTRPPVPPLSAWYLHDSNVSVLLEPAGTDRTDTRRFYLQRRLPLSSLVSGFLSTQDLEGETEEPAAPTLGGGGGTPSKVAAAEPVDFDQVTSSLATPLGPVRRGSLSHLARGASARKESIRSVLSFGFKNDHGA